MSKNRSHQRCLMLVGKTNHHQPAANQESPQQKAAKTRAITFKMVRHEETVPVQQSTPYYATGGLRDKWPLERAQEYLKENLSKYKITFPMNVLMDNGATLQITETVDMSKEGREKWIFYNGKPCLLRGHTILPSGNGSTSMSYDFEEIFDPITGDC